MSNSPLLDEDVEFLNANYPGWKRQKENSAVGIVIRNYELPKGYEPDKSNLMIIVPDGYPVAMIDMFYFYPDIKREDGMIIERLTTQTFFGKPWQQWSRHYTNQPWTPGQDNLISHIEWVRNQLKSELGG